METADHQAHSDRDRSRFAPTDRADPVNDLIEDVLRHYAPEIGLSRMLLVADEIRSALANVGILNEPWDGSPILHDSSDGATLDLIPVYAFRFP
jgi:hypothetical protein